MMPVPLGQTFKRDIDVDDSVTVFLPKEREPVVGRVVSTRGMSDGSRTAVWVGVQLRAWAPTNNFIVAPGRRATSAKVLPAVIGLDFSHLIDYRVRKNEIESRG
jgi:hypothetical protein